MWEILVTVTVILSGTTHNFNWVSKPIHKNSCGYHAMRVAEQVQHRVSKLPKNAQVNVNILCNRPRKFIV